MLIFTSFNRMPLVWSFADNTTKAITKTSLKFHVIILYYYYYVFAHVIAHLCESLIWCGLLFSRECFVVVVISLFWSCFLLRFTCGIDFYSISYMLVRYRLRAKLRALSIYFIQSKRCFVYMYILHCLFSIWHDTYANTYGKRVGSSNWKHT